MYRKPYLRLQRFDLVGLHKGTSYFYDGLDAEQLADIVKNASGAIIKTGDTAPPLIEVFVPNIAHPLV